MYNALLFIVISPVFTGKEELATVLLYNCKFLLNNIHIQL